MKLLTSLLFFAALTCAWADLTVPRMNKAPILDGVIATGEWPAMKVTFFETVTEKPAQNQTSLCMGFDDDNIYLAFQYAATQMDDKNSGLFASSRFEIRLGDKKIDYYIIADNGKRIPTDGWEIAQKPGIMEIRIPRELLDGDGIYRGNIARADGTRISTLFPLKENNLPSVKYHQKFILGSIAEVNAAQKIKKSKASQEQATALKKAEEFASLPQPEALGDNAVSFNVSSLWKPYVLEQSGKDFHFVFAPRYTNFTVPNMPNTLPLFQDAAYQVHVWDLDKGMREPEHTLEKLLEAPEDHAAGYILKKTGNPIYYRTEGGYHTTEDMLKISKEAREIFISKYGKRLLAFDENESLGPSGGFPMIMGLAGRTPRNKQEAYAALKATAYDPRRTFIRDWAVFYPEFAPYRSPVSATFTDHIYLSFGFRMAGNECGPKTLCMPYSYAVSRGAARQYGKPFRIYLTTHDDKITFPGWEGAYRHYTMNDFRYARFPDSFRHSSGQIKGQQTFGAGGPQYGVQHADWRRCFIYAYMAGTSTFFDESNHYLMYARYDYRTIDKEDPLAVNLREPKTHLSKMGAAMAEFYDNIVCRENRGSVYTPVAIMWDLYHGHFSNYHAMPWGLYENTEGDLMMSATMNTLFPETPDKIRYSRGFRTSPYGDVFDVITNDAKQDVLNAYPSIFFCGDVPVDSAFADKLLSYVKQGGTLAVNYRQLESVFSLFPKDFFGAEVSSERRKAKCSYSSFSGKVLFEEKAFSYHVATLKAGAQNAVFTVDENQDPLVIVSRFGKGKVILTMPDFLKERYSNKTMLQIFGDLMLQLGRGALPVALDGDIEFQVSRNKTGWIVALYNNYGVGFNATWKNPQAPPDAEFDRKVTITPRFKCKSVREWFTGGSELTLTVPAGDVRIVELEL